MKPTVDQVLRELERISQSGLLSPQERALFQRIVQQTVEGDTARLYQKALADELGIASAKQIGVIATRLRAKLAEHYRLSQDLPAVQIELPDRGYEARFFYRPPVFALSDRGQLLVADAKAAIDQRTLPGAATALKFLDLALEGHARHPLILALKAYCHATRALYGTYPRSDLETAAAIVEQARATDDRPWESWFAEACVKMALHWDWPGAGTCFEQAIALSGGAAQYQPWYTAFLACQSRAAEAVALLRVAVGRAHDSPIVRADLAASQIYAGQLGDAEDTIRTAFALFGVRTHYLLHVHLAMLHEARGEGRAALAAIDRLPLKWPRTTITLGLRALFSGLTGDRRTARRHFAKLRAARAIAGRYIPAGQLCIAALGAGDSTAAVAWLREGAIVERDPNLVLTNVYPFFRHLHHDEGFRTFVQDTMRLRLSANASPDGLERDELDAASCAFLLRDSRTGEAAACQRFILPERLRSGLVTNAERFSSDLAVDFDGLPRQSWAEVSRSTIGPKYRWGSSGTSLPAMVAIKYASIALAVALDRRTLFSISDPRTARLTRRLGFKLHQVGAPIEFHGLRALFRIDVAEVLQSVPSGMQRSLSQLIAGAERALAASV